jgi:sugar lactone lactonase YvrE
MTVAEQVTGACAYHAEGPIWDDAAGCVRWVDMLAGDVLSLPAAGGGVERLRVGDVAAAVRPASAAGSWWPSSGASPWSMPAAS